MSLRNLEQQFARVGRKLIPLPELPSTPAGTVHAAELTRLGWLEEGTAAIEALTDGKTDYYVVVGRGRVAGHDIAVIGSDGKIRGWAVRHPSGTFAAAEPALGRRYIPDHPIYTVERRID